MGLFNRNNEEKKEMPRNPDTVFMFRALASGYILYLVYETIKLYLAGDEGVSLPVVIISSVVLGAGAIYILISSFLQWRKEKQATAEAEDAIEETENEDEEPSDTQSE